MPNWMDRPGYRNWPATRPCCITSATKPKKARTPSWKNVIRIGRNTLSSLKQNPTRRSIIFHMDIEKREIYRSIAELAYVIAMADKGLSAEERFAFTKIAEEELDFESWAAQSRFELLDEVIQPSI